METTNPGQDDSEGINRRVVVVTDSASAIPPEMAAEFGIGIAPMEITIDGRTHIEGPSGSLRTFYTDLLQADRLPTTSAPKPQVWLDTFNEAAKVAESVLCITLASNLSAAYDAARVAKDLAQDELPNTNIRVFDSKSAAGSQALIALAKRHAPPPAEIRSTKWNPQPSTSRRVSVSWPSSKRLSSSTRAGACPGSPSGRPNCWT